MVPIVELSNITNSPSSVVKDTVLVTVRFSENENTSYSNYILLSESKAISNSSYWWFLAITKSKKKKLR
jgi:hypothetical protein